MSIEKNRNTLKGAIDQMKSYTAPENLWENIQNGLDQELDSSEEALHSAVGQLPQHSPPADVWNQLAKSLDAKQPQKVFQIRNYNKWLSIAAAALVLLVAVFWVFGETAPKITKQYAQETMQQFQLNIDWDGDEDSFDKLNDQLAQIDNPKLNNLKMELVELTSARHEVEDMLKSYGQDPQLVNQLGDIERERSDVYRQIIELI